MDQAEAQRQYQVTLEARRRLRDHAQGSVSFEQELESADREVEAAERVRDLTWAGIPA